MKRLFSLILPLFLFASCPPEGFETIPDKNTVKIKTPDLQDRKTAKIKLCNGLQAYIISDPNIDQSAAALTVGAGSWQDDPKYPGIAHYLEHLLFLGNEKYPEEDQFMGYVKSNGGIVNAYTASDRTVYMFSINNENFTSALDQFSHFFIDPLFDPSGVKRELHAVDQENAKNIENDGWREWMIFKATGNPDSPNAKFSTGNAETLGTIPPSEVREWWKKHYSADEMYLFIYSNLPLDELKKLAAQDFGPIEKRDVDNTLDFVPLMSNGQKGHTFFVEPIQDLRTLAFTWDLPPWTIENMGAKIPELVGYALSNKSTDSLEAYLKERGLATGVVASTGRLSKVNAVFEIDIQLTKKGVENIDEITTAVFETINGLKTSGIPEYIFKEQAQMATINYEWQTREKPFFYAMTVAGQLPYENLATFPDQTLFYKSYKPKELKKFIDLLSPETCLFTVTAPSELTGVEPKRQERWLGGRYTSMAQEDTKLQMLSSAQPDPEIGLPKANPFLPTNLEMVANQDDSPTPTIVSDDAFGKTYYTNASDFKSPEIAWIFSFKSPLIDATPKHSALLDLYTKAVEDSLTSPLSYASTAGLQAWFEKSDFKLKLQIQGFSSKAKDLLGIVTETMKTVHPTEDQFNVYKEAILSSYQNQQKSMPFYQANRKMASLITNVTPTVKALEKALNKITYEDFLSFSKSLFSQIYTENLLAGNLSPIDAQAITAQMQEAFTARPYPKNEQRETQIFVLNQESGPYAIKSDTSMQGNVCLLLIEQGPFSYKSAAAQQILGSALSDDFFKTLRTKQQTGYIAKGWDMRQSGELLQFFAVQSATHEPDDLLARFELFIETFVKDFSAEFSETRFKETQAGVITTLENPPTNLNDLTSRLYKFAFEKNGDFNYLENIAAAAKSMTYDEIHQFTLDFFSRKNKRRLALLLQGQETESTFDYNTITSLSLQSHGSY